MAEPSLDELIDFVKAQDEGPAAVLDAIGRLDVNLEGEDIVRLTLLLEEPAGDTWDLDQLDVLKRAIQRKAWALGLPRVSNTLVARSEADAVEAFAGT